MNIIECINNRRSIRSFTDKKIDKNIITELITLGTKAATGSGHEAWGFAVITDKDQMKQLSDGTKKYILENFEKYPYLKQYESWLTNEKFNIFYNAPCLLIIYGDTNSHWYTYDCTLAASNIMLSASEYGIGTCWIGFGEHTLDTADFKSKHNVPSNYKLVCPMVLGYPKAQLTAPIRKPAPIFFNE